MRGITRRELLHRTGKTALGGLTASLLADVATARAAPAAARPPNIVLIFIDDLGWAELGCYGNRFNETPHIDRLAAQGMRFTDAYSAAPVCSPTRAALMTGQYPARVGITDYLRADDDKHLSPDRVTLNEPLGARDYKTAWVGKWHLTGDYAKKRGEPSRHGFDEVIGNETSYIAGGKYFHPYFFMKGLPARWKGEYLTDRLSWEAADFIARHKDDPFCLFLSHYSVHTRLAGKKKLVEKYKAKPGAGKRKNNPVLAAMIESIDEGVGLILRRLAELGIADNTLVAFTSDNGGEDRVTSNAPLRGGKSQLYEGGIRVPLIVRWPGVVDPGTVCNVPVDTVDFYPTFLDAGAATPAAGHIFDGESLLPLLKRTGGLKRNALFWHYPLAKPHFLGGKSGGAIRRGDLKLIEFYGTGKLELYDLKADPGERNDLSGERPDEAAALRRRLAQWRDRVGATVPGR